MNWNLRNIAERAASTAVFTFFSVIAALPATNFTSVGNALEPAAVAALIATAASISKNLTAEGVVVQAAKRGAVIEP